jgi:hypothetical protein
MRFVGDVDTRNLCSIRWCRTNNYNSHNKARKIENFCRSCPKPNPVNAILKKDCYSLNSDRMV